MDQPCMPFQLIVCSDQIPSAKTYPCYNWYVTTVNLYAFNKTNEKNRKHLHTGPSLSIWREAIYIQQRWWERCVCVCGRELWERDRGRWKNKAASLISYRCLDRVAWLAPNSLQAYRPLMSSNYFLFKKVIKKKDELYRKWRMNMGNWAVFRLHFLLFQRPFIFYFHCNENDPQWNLAYPILTFFFRTYRPNNTEKLNKSHESHFLKT